MLNPPMRARRFLVLGIFLLAACSGTDDGDEQPSTSAASPAESAQEDPAAPSGGSDGTFTLDGTTYTFQVRACDFSGESDDMVQTVAGRGELPDGEPFDLFISRNEVSGMLVHTVSFQSGNVMRGEGTVLEAQRMRSGGAWTSLDGAATEGLIQIDGRNLTATGLFRNADGTGGALEGQVQVTCN